MARLSRYNAPLTILLSIALIAGCTIQKRKHLSGYHVQWLSKPDKIQKEGEEKGFDYVEKIEKGSAEKSMEKNQSELISAETERNQNPETATKKEVTADPLLKEEKEKSLSAGESFERNDFMIEKLERQVQNWQIILYVSIGLTIFFFPMVIFFLIALIIYRRKKKQLDSYRNSGRDTQDDDFDYYSKDRNESEPPSTENRSNGSKDTSLAAIILISILLYIMIIFLFAALIYFFLVLFA